MIIDKVSCSPSQILRSAKPFHLFLKATTFPTQSAAMAILLGALHCQMCGSEDIAMSMGAANTAAARSKPPLDCRRAYDHSSISFGCKNSLFGTMQSHWLQSGRESFSSTKITVASDYSDSVSNSGSSYHPLEEVKESVRRRDRMLTEAEIARTTIEANSKILLVFPGTVHSEPHGHFSWAEFPYVVDDYGDIFIEIFDDENILYDRQAINPVKAFIGMDLPIFGGSQRAMTEHSNYLERSIYPNISLNNENLEFVDDERIDLGVSDTERKIHPRHFAKRMAKAVQSKYARMMECPTNGLSIFGSLRPAFVDEESHLRSLFHGDASYASEWEDAGKEWNQLESSYNLLEYGDIMDSTLYKLEIMQIELFSIYGSNVVVDLQDFQVAEPDLLVHSASTIIEHFSEYGVKGILALKSLCRKKMGLNVEGANLIGVDSLGMDVRVFSGLEAQTLRFSFTNRATTEVAAEKKIHKMLFPRNHHNRVARNPSDGRHPAI